MTETAARNLVLTELPEAYPAIAEAREAGDVRLMRRSGTHGSPLRRTP
jgi:hypothetical protein